ncbi:MAG: hypothetical protein HC913_07515 [Microscillaceae bacterium]|nr:hypothetical protein [Microscillaceae bacterium]
MIYELLVRDFDTPQNFQAVIDRLDYLQDLGVNAIELMPIMEFAGNISWGYNPIFFTAVDKAYGTRNKLKELIDKCHERGMAVILDMVLNHADFEYPYVKMYFANGQPTNNPWFNPQATHPFSVFFDFNHESDYTKTIMDQINRYWLEEFRFDGYRFDLSKGFTQTQSGSDVGLWSSRDNSRIAILKRMADAIWAYDPEAYVILEHFADNSEEKELAEYRAAEGKGMMTWGNLHGPYKENVLGFSNNSNITGISAQNLTNGGGRGWNVAHLVGYMESHDEERQMVDALQFGNSASGHNVRNRDTALDRLKTAAAFLYTVPGPKMLWQFGELGYDFSINYCPNGSISNDCRTDPKPIRWDYNEDAERQKVYKAMAELIKMRIQYDVFETSDVSIIGGNNLVKLMTITPESFSPNPASANEMSVHIIGNFNVTPQTLSASFQHTGTWYDYFSGSMNAPVNITAQSQSFTLQPGEFRLFTNFPLPSPELELTRYTRPKAPLMAAASALSDIEVQLTWDDVSATETSYKILRSSTPGGSFTEVGTVEANVETFTDRSGLSAQTTYYYKIVSNNNAGENASAEVSVSTLAPVANPPAAPTNLTAVVVPSGPSVDLAWNDVANNETRYVVERRLASGGSFAAIAQLPANRTSYIDATAQDGESYVYRVGAGIGSVVAYSNEVSLEVLALENNALSQAIRLAPHPGNPMRVMFEGLLVQEVRCRLRDLYGRAVRDFGPLRLNGATSVSLNLDGLNPGVYLLEIETEKGRAVKRMVRY